MRNDKRDTVEFRPMAVIYDQMPYAVGSVIFSLGSTKVLCSVMFQSGVPPFLKGQKRGWLTADYSLLPASTPQRSPRDVALGKKKGRSVEIDRLIGRALRSVVDLDALGENTLFIDCDVICADGGTRCASICGAFLALKAANIWLLKTKAISRSFLVDEIAALSIGLVKDQLLTDLNCAEDNEAQADFNFIITRSGKLIEVQGGAEANPVDRVQFEEAVSRAFQSSELVFAFYDSHPYIISADSMRIVCSPKYDV